MSVSITSGWSQVINCSTVIGFPDDISWFIEPKLANEVEITGTIQIIANFCMPKLDPELISKPKQITGHKILSIDAIYLKRNRKLLKWKEKALGLKRTRRQRDKRNSRSGKKRRHQPRDGSSCVVFDVLDFGWMKGMTRLGVTNTAVWCTTNAYLNIGRPYKSNDSKITLTLSVTFLLVENRHLKVRNFLLFWKRIGYIADLHNKMQTRIRHICSCLFRTIDVID